MGTETDFERCASWVTDKGRCVLPVGHGGYHVGTPGTPQYGVKTCGKSAEEPFAGLGPCRLEPDHDGLCKYAVPGVPGGLMSFREMPMPQLEDHPWYSDEEVLKWRRRGRRAFWGSMAAFALNLAVTVWVVLRAFEILP